MRPKALTYGFTILLAGASVSCGSEQDRIVGTWQVHRGVQRQTGLASGMVFAKFLKDGTGSVISWPATWRKGEDKFYEVTIRGNIKYWTLFVGTRADGEELTLFFHFREDMLIFRADKEGADLFELKRSE